MTNVRFAALAYFCDSLFRFPLSLEIRHWSLLASSVAFSHDEVQTPQHRWHIADHATWQKLRQDTEVYKRWRANLQPIGNAATPAVDVEAQLALWILRCEVNL